MSELRDWATGGIIPTTPDDDDLVPVLLDNGYVLPREPDRGVNLAGPGDYECYHCQRGNCGRCNDPSCTCCYGNED